MKQAASKTQILLAQVAVTLVIGFVVVGVSLYGVGSNVRHRIWLDLLDRPGGPMTFRIILQPVMAAIAALFDGIRDAKDGRSPYVSTMLSNPAERGTLLREGVISTARIILLGLGVDAIYQLVVLKTFYPAEAVIVAITLAFVPYLFLRGPVRRIAYWWRAEAPADGNR
ncbi:hypothetical protein [Rhizobium leguminosarum]|jgi:hypothetical protein|uniref:hypothetical protein n=1 Tax=Rhizobium leguminosarum TaxID=384 RepID=UPI001FDFB0B4|nr:hypothetical protein [Rhizobium leguminosarum]